MSATKFIDGVCEHCGGQLEFPADAAGTTSNCPHCGQSTELRLSTDGTQGRTPGKTVVFIVLALIILGGGLIAAMIALNRVKRMAEQRHPPAVTNSIASANPFAAQDFSASPVKIETAPGTTVIRATGSVKNLSTKRRFGVRVEIELKDDSGKALEKAKDYTPTIEPGAEWRFNALVLPKNAASGRVTAIAEEK